MALVKGQKVVADGIVGEAIGTTKHIVHFGRYQAILPNEHLHPVTDTIKHDDIAETTFRVMNPSK